MMFIETLEFTIPVDLCSLCTTLQKGALSDLEFPASVNSYGTTQDASIQVALRANKLTFKIDGVSSNASIISKSECKTLKLSVFDVDRSLIPQENYSFNSSNVSYLQHSTPVLNTLKRTHEQLSNTSTPVQPKVRRTSHDANRKKNRSPNSVRSSDFHTNHQSKEQTPNNVIVKTEPDDPDLIEIEPDPETIKTEAPQTQTDNSANAYPQTSHSSTSSSYERNVPHVPDYAEASTSHHDQQDNHTVEDFLVFQDDNYDAEDNEADYSNDDVGDARRAGDQYLEFSSHRASASCKQSHIVDESAVYIENLEIKDASYVDDCIQSQARSRHFAIVEESELESIHPDTGQTGVPATKSTLKNTNWGVRLFKHSGCSYQGQTLPESRALILGRGTHTETSFMDSDSFLPHGDELYYQPISVTFPRQSKDKFQCEECGKCFTEAGTKKVHIESVHNNAVFPCECGKTYRYLRALRRHKKSGSCIVQQQN